MKARITLSNFIFKCDFSQGIDISVPHVQTLAWDSPQVKIEPVRAGDWTGSVDAGAPVNFCNVFFNPHGTGTHTEGPGHILLGKPSVNAHVPKGIMLALLISVFPEQTENGYAVTRRVLQELWPQDIHFEALIIRTLPNDQAVKTSDRSGTNPPYITTDAMRFINEKRIEHLLFDQPSVDPEKDNGELAAHKVFWNVPNQPQFDKTITELIFVPDEAEDGFYALNIQTAPFENDALPSRPVLFPVEF
ncbi:MAG: cyclase family protein [Flavobacteriales bacterium]